MSKPKVRKQSLNKNAAKANYYKILNKIFFPKSFFAFVIIFLNLTLPANSVLADKVKIVVTTTDLKYLAEQIGAEKVEVESMIRGFDDPHFVMTRPDFLIKMNKADMFCMIGLDLEIGWVPLLLEQSRNISIQKGQNGYCDASIGINILGKPNVAVDRSMGDLHIYGNPHYWLDPVNMIQMGFNILNNLRLVDPENEAYYKNNFLKFKDKMTQLVRSEMKNMQAHFGLKVAVFHQEFVYLASRFKFNANLSIEERPGIPPSSRYLENVIKTMNSQNIKIILISPVNNPKYAEYVASKVKGAKVLVMPTSVGALPEANTYEDCIQIILRKIREANN
ncbi:MAG: zinc ABC transporter substrate-binding protein [Leptospira sp.]|nr:zinc ABC transporter substrate-binding protein [Leptospira sp.]